MEHARGTGPGRVPRTSLPQATALKATALIGRRRPGRQGWCNRCPCRVVAQMLAPGPARNAMEGRGTGSFRRRGTVPRRAVAWVRWCSRVARWRLPCRFQRRVGGRFGVRAWIRHPGTAAGRRWRAERAGCPWGRVFTGPGACRLHSVGPDRPVPFRRTCRSGCPPECCRRFRRMCRPEFCRTCRGRFNAHSATALYPCWSEPSSSDTVYFDTSPHEGRGSPGSCRREGGGRRDRSRSNGT